MYIKLKHIKQFLLVLACLLLAGLNYFKFVQADNLTDKCNINIDADCDGLTNEEEKLYGTNPEKADSGNCGYSDGVNVKAGYNPLTCQKFASASSEQISAADTISSSSQTIDFTSKLNQFIQSKNGQPIASTDIQSFVDQQIASQVGDPITFDNLAGVERDQLKIKPQAYSNLSDEAKKAKLQEDAANYLISIGYLLASNTPTAITSGNEFNAFKEEFVAHLQTLGTQTPDYAYFRDLGTRLELFKSQLANIEVPESMVDLHIKFIKLINGYLALKDNSISQTDSISQIALSIKLNQLAKLTDEFFAQDFASYISQLK